MALRAVTDHPKFANLKHRLQLGKGPVLGYLECVWHFTSKFSPAGNIGKYTDAESSWVEWDGQPGFLVECLIESNWLHRHENPEFRIVIHDWPTWADETVNTTLARSCMLFWDGTVPKSGRLNQHERNRFKKWLDESVNGQPEVSQDPDSRVEVPASAPIPVPVPVPVPVIKTFPLPPKPETAGASDDQLSEIAAGYDRHQKFLNSEPREHVIRLVISMNGQFDIQKFRENHGPYCEYQTKNGWNFCTLSFLGWIRAGMPNSPEVKTVAEAKKEPKFGCTRCNVNPCNCFAAQAAKDAAWRKEILARGKSKSV